MQRENSGLRRGHRNGLLGMQAKLKSFSSRQKMGLLAFLWWASRDGRGLLAFALVSKQEDFSLLDQKNFLSAYFSYVKI